MGVPSEALNWRLVVSGPTPETSMSAPGADRRLETPPIKTARPAYFPEAGGHIETPVYDPYRLQTGMRVDGSPLARGGGATTGPGPHDPRPAGGPLHPPPPAPPPTSPT